MSNRLHTYGACLDWTGNTGEGTSRYDAYSRSYEISIAGKPKLIGSSDPAFRGDSRYHNPEELLLAAVSSCHMLWFLHLAAIKGVVVTSYSDQVSGQMEESEDGGGRFTEIVLRPIVRVTHASMADQVPELHHEANRKCFIANSLSIPVRHISEVHF